MQRISAEFLAHNEHLCLLAVADEAALTRGLSDRLRRLHAGRSRTPRPGVGDGSAAAGGVVVEGRVAPAVRHVHRCRRGEEEGDGVSAALGAGEVLLLWS